MKAWYLLSDSYRKCIESIITKENELAGDRMNRGSFVRRVNQTNKKTIIENDQTVWYVLVIEILKKLHVSLWNNPKIMLYQSQTFKCHLPNKTVLCVIKFGTVLDYVCHKYNAYTQGNFLICFWSRLPCLWYKRSIYIRCLI